MVDFLKGKFVCPHFKCGKCKLLDKKENKKDFSEGYKSKDISKPQEQLFENMDDIEFEEILDEWLNGEAKGDDLYH